MARLTVRERLARSLRNEDVDRPAIFDKLRNNEIIEHYAGRPLGIHDLETVCRAAANCLDCICNVRGPATPERRILENGCVQETQKWTTWWERGVKTVEQLVEVMKARIHAPRPSDAERRDRIRQGVDYYQTLQSWCGESCLVAVNAPGVGIDGLIQTAGLEIFSYMIAEHPGLDDEYYERCTVEAVADSHILAEYNLAPFVHTGEDIAFKTGTLVSPAYLREKIFPRLKRVCDVWREAGCAVQFHSDGDLRAIIPDFIAAGVDSLHPMETLAGMDIPGVAAEFGDQLLYCGGVDVSQLLPFGTPEEVREEVYRIVDAVGPSRVWIGSTTEVNDEVPLANYQALVDAVRSWPERGAR